LSCVGASTSSVSSRVLDVHVERVAVGLTEPGLRRRQPEATQVGHRQRRGLDLREPDGRGVGEVVGELLHQSAARAAQAVDGVEQPGHVQSGEDRRHQRPVARPSRGERGRRGRGLRGRRRALTLRGVAHQRPPGDQPSQRPVAAGAADQRGLRRCRQPVAGDASQPGREQTTTGASDQAELAGRRRAQKGVTRGLPRLVGGLLARVVHVDR
jgi:hypothetical protein